MIKINDNRDPKLSKDKTYYSCNFLYIDEEGKKQRTPTERFYVRTIAEARREREKYREEMERKLNNVTVYSGMTLTEYCNDWQRRRATGELLVKGKPVKQSTLTRDSKIELPKIKAMLGDTIVANITERTMCTA